VRWRQATMDDAHPDSGLRSSYELRQTPQHFAGWVTTRASPSRVGGQTQQRLVAHSGRPSPKARLLTPAVQFSRIGTCVACTEYPAVTVNALSRSAPLTSRWSINSCQPRHFREYLCLASIRVARFHSRSPSPLSGRSYPAAPHSEPGGPRGFASSLPWSRRSSHNHRALLLMDGQQASHVERTPAAAAARRVSA